MKKRWFAGMLSLAMAVVLTAATDVSAAEKKTGVFPEWREEIPHKPESRPAEIKYYKGEYWRLVGQRAWEDDTGKHLEKVWQNSEGKQHIEKVK